MAKPMPHSTGVFQKETAIRNRQARMKNTGSARFTWGRRTELWALTLSRCQPVGLYQPLPSHTSHVLSSLKVLCPHPTPALLPSLELSSPSGLPSLSHRTPRADPAPLALSPFLPACSKHGSGLPGMSRTPIECCQRLPGSGPCWFSLSQPCAGLGLWRTETLLCSTLTLTQHTVPGSNYPKHRRC